MTKGEEEKMMMNDELNVLNKKGTNDMEMKMKEQGALRVLARARRLRAAREERDARRHSLLTVSAGRV